MVITTTSTSTMPVSLAATRNTTIAPTSEMTLSASAAATTTVAAASVATAGSSLLTNSSNSSALTQPQPCTCSCSTSSSMQHHRKRRRRQGGSNTKSSCLDETSHHNNKNYYYTFDRFLSQEGQDNPKTASAGDKSDDDGNNVRRKQRLQPSSGQWRNDRQHHTQGLWRETIMNHVLNSTRSHPCLLAQRQVGLWPKYAAYAWQCRMLWTTTATKNSSGATASTFCATNKNQREARTFPARPQNRDDPDDDYCCYYDFDDEDDASFSLSEPATSKTATTMEPMTLRHYDFASYARRRILFTSLHTPVQEALLGLERTGSYVVCLGSGHDDVMDQNQDHGDHHHAGGTGRPVETNPVLPDLYLRFYGMCEYERVRWYQHTPDRTDRFSLQQ